MQSCTTVAEAPQKAAAAEERVGGPPFVGVLRRCCMHGVESCETMVVRIVVAVTYQKVVPTKVYLGRFVYRKICSMRWDASSSNGSSTSVEAFDS